MSNCNFKLPLDEILKNITIIKSYCDFLKQNIIELNNITRVNSSFLPMFYNDKYDYLGFEIKSNEKYVSVNIRISDKKINITKGDELTFYFENNEFLNFKFNGGSIKHPDYNLNIVIPNLHQLEMLGFYDLKYWRLSSKKNKNFIQGDNTIFNQLNNMSNKTDSQEVLKHMTRIIVNEMIKASIKHDEYNDSKFKKITN